MARLRFSGLDRKEHLAGHVLRNREEQRHQQVPGGTAQQLVARVRERQIDERVSPAIRRAGESGGPAGA